jgi:phosphatidylglycerophosphatase A
MTMANLIGGVCGLNRLPFAGALAAALTILVCWVLHWIGGFPLVLIATISAALKTIYAAPRMSGLLISDRVVGQVIALWPLSAGLWWMDAPAYLFPWPGWLGALVICLAITSLPPMRRLNAKSPLLDDIIAGVATAAISTVMAGFSHGWF